MIESKIDVEFWFNSLDEPYYKNKIYDKGQLYREITITADFIKMFEALKK